MDTSNMDFAMHMASSLVAIGKRLAFVAALGAVLGSCGC
jgi:hypothetical protein